MMFGPFQVLFWIAEHWWILAVVAMAALALLLWTGIVQLAAVMVAAAKIAAAIARFFATPAEQIAAKILFGFCVAVLALSVGFQHGRHVTNATWARREAERVAAMERLRAEARLDARARAARSRQQAHRRRQDLLAAHGRELCEGRVMAPRDSTME